MQQKRHRIFIMGRKCAPLEVFQVLKPDADSP